MHTVRLAPFGTLALGAVLLVSGCVNGEDVHIAIVTVTVSGTGNGTVAGPVDPGEVDLYASLFSQIQCRKGSGRCTVSTDLDQRGPTTVTLTATPDPGSSFVGWTWCSATAEDPFKATLRLDAEVGYECDATFDAPPPDPNACNNPFVLFSDFENPSVWELWDGDASNGSYQTSGGNPGAYRLEESERLPGLGKYEWDYYLRTEVYDPADAGAVTGILYSEDRIVLTGLDAGEGITGGLYLQNEHTVFQGALDGGALFTGSSWTTVSERFDVPPERTNVPFRVGYWRTSNVLPGSGAIQAGIDNVRISICR